MATSNYTLKINIRAQEEREKREKKKASILIRPSTTTTRKRRTFQFNEPGKYVQEGERLRKQAKLKELQSRIAARAAKVGITDVVKLASLTHSTESKALQDIAEDVPCIEWWDEQFLGDKSLEKAILELDQNLPCEKIFGNITNMIEHPSKKVSLTVHPEVPLFLTKQECKKLRREKRREAEMEKREKTKLGLLPKPEPKLRQSNIIHALTKDDVINPSSLELIVKEQEEIRKKAHLEHNLTNQADPKQRKARKLDKELSGGIFVCVYRIASLENLSHKFKLKRNAIQSNLTGLMLLYKDFNLIIVEGSSRQLKKYKNLVISRIKWNEEESDSSSNNTHNKAELVWEGQVPERNFRVFKVKSVQTEKEARDFFKLNKVVHYWDLGQRVGILSNLD